MQSVNWKADFNETIQSLESQEKEKRVALEQLVDQHAKETRGNSKSATTEALLQRNKADVIYEIVRIELEIAESRKEILNNLGNSAAQVQKRLKSLFQL